MQALVEISLEPFRVCPSDHYQGATEGIFRSRESIMSNSNGASDRRNCFYERSLRVRARDGASGGSEAVERILVLMALSVLIFFLVLSPNTAGADALLPQLYPGITAGATEDTLRMWATDVGRAGWDSAYGAGKLNLVLTFDSIPTIRSITDVPGDQGLAVEVAWKGSGYDNAGSPRAVTAYDIFRRNGAGGWDSVATVPARGEADYASKVPTEVDSTVSGGIAYSAFFVRGRTSAPVHYFESSPDSGYSVDNIVPPPPTGLAVGYTDLGGNFVLWDPCPEPDIDHYNIYRGESDDFTPDPGALVYAASDTFWVDPVLNGYLYTYKVTAVDDTGNEGEPAAPVIRTDAECCEIPLRYNLHQNFPNPFNPVTTIKFDIRERARVRLVVYNVNGQRVRVLMDGEVPQGSREVVWNGRDDAGRSVASGIYFYRLESPGFVQSRKMILLK